MIYIRKSKLKEKVEIKNSNSPSTSVRISYHCGLFQMAVFFHNHNNNNFHMWIKYIWKSGVMKLIQLVADQYLFKNSTPDRFQDIYIFIRNKCSLLQCWKLKFNWRFFLCCHFEHILQNAWGNLLTQLDIFQKGYFCVSAFTVFHFDFKLILSLKGETNWIRTFSTA